MSKKRRASDTDVALWDPHTHRQAALRRRRGLQQLEAELLAVNQGLIAQQPALVECEDLLIRSEASYDYPPNPKPSISEPLTGASTLHAVAALVECEDLLIRSQASYHTYPLNP